LTGQIEYSSLFKVAYGRYSKKKEGTLSCASHEEGNVGEIRNAAEDFVM